MKSTIWTVIALAAICAHAAERTTEFAAGRDYYAAAEFGKAANRFRFSCDTANDAEACYWAGVSYDRLADIHMPFGCRTEAKAHRYLLKATQMAPEVSIYRAALFDFLLDDADCSRTALPEAAAMLSGTPGSDPDYNLMRIRFQQASRESASADVRLGKLFLIVPRAAYRVAAFPAAILGNRRAPNSCVMPFCGGSLQKPGVKDSGPSF